MHDKDNVHTLCDINTEISDGNHDFVSDGPDQEGLLKEILIL